MLRLALLSTTCAMLRKKFDEPRKARKKTIRLWRGVLSIRRSVMFAPGTVDVGISALQD